MTMSTSVNPNDPCGFCVRKTKHEKLCDFPIAKGKNTKRYTCSARLCSEHGFVLANGLDLCPPHAKLVAAHGLAPRLLPLLQQASVESHRVALDLVGQAVGVLRHDWWEYFSERAAIAEFEGGLSREAAETQAWALLADRR